MRILKENCSFVVVDIQDRLFPHIHQNEILTQKCSTLIKGMKILEIPTIVTVQYKKGLGDTVPAIQEALGDHKALEKMTFSCCGLGEFNMRIEEHYKENIILSGIESHVCVLQTALDLVESGHRPVVVVDAVSSRNPLDKEIALKRMAQEGIRLTTVEAILFELCKTSDSKSFKAISQLVK
ncbi:MAG: hydrolase [Crocinitomicaceae bacterium]|mgnify:CR=1 FL=1|nr:hydrolase [Crocinitomicaceae bacterium]|tara:strand:- start:12549 stop:13091 length:543 start_codon:yes stop_codon:yes gene_type:complete